MSDEKVQFAPFHAINEFMIPEYRQKVIRLVFENSQQLPDLMRVALNNQVKKQVSIPGFRNSAQAPVGLKIRNAEQAFERKAGFAALMLSSWAELHADLRQRVYDLLQERGWETLPPDIDRTRLPGFLVTWPGAETYDILDEAFSQKYPDSDAVSVDDLRLMIVWVSTRLPYEKVEPSAQED